MASALCFSPSVAAAKVAAPKSGKATTMSIAFNFKKAAIGATGVATSLLLAATPAMAVNMPNELATIANAPGLEREGVSNIPSDLVQDPLTNANDMNEAEKDGIEIAFVAVPLAILIAGGTYAVLPYRDADTKNLF